MSQSAPPHRAGFVAIVGRPNAGKSTLLNRYVGEHLAIVSRKPQTTRNRILGVVTEQNFQVAFLDTPGIHQARGPLNAFMVDVALQAIGEVDAVLWMVEAVTGKDGSVEIGEGNRFIAERLAQSRKPVVLGLNKIDLLADKRRLLPIIDAYQNLLPGTELRPISAAEGEGTEALLHKLASLMPVSPALFPDDVLTDQAEREMVAEYIREQLLENLHQELPYSAAVRVEQFDESLRLGEADTQRGPLGGESEREDRDGKNRKGLVRIDAVIFLERDSQKAIVIGKGGAMLKKLGTRARARIERLLGARVFLQLTVRVEPRWTESAKSLEKLGYRR